MRELSTHEIKNVSGSGIYASIGSGVGYIAGKALEYFIKSSTSLTSALSTLGQGIGLAIESFTPLDVISLFNAAKQIYSGVTGIIGNWPVEGISLQS
ncbi:hypothetical protein [Commensalibacter oyaizuii]|uniref:Uncharacterized protein n=1 Tax=Commensalibacter oyaizuii TaxID=3043873 RepID=A0ABT6Q1N4_9PROT|nr:hypothetical protein [Commensalibacter sp. TBRC 16381]MDI2090998.1 hypothetical protein [Commensalibacter sp. TBRC 16381]